MNVRLISAAMLFLAAIGQASAQNSILELLQAPAEDSLLVEVGTHYLDDCIKGYSKGEILGVEGKTHFVYVPVEVKGFAHFLPFHRREEDLRQFGREPFSIDVDKVLSLKVNGLYQEHMIIGGKRKHILATRLINGPVELFNFTQVSAGVPMMGAGMPGGGYTGGRTLSYWYLRRQGGELERVEREKFVEQMSRYFYDDSDLVATLTRKKQKLRYEDMVILVRAYNRHRVSAEAGAPAAK